MTKDFMPLGDTNTLTGDSTSNQYDGGMLEAYSGSAPTRPQSRVLNVSPKSPTESTNKLPVPTLNRAYKTLEFFQLNPQWLADPDTTHAANAILGTSAKMIEMAVQLERVNVQSEAARLKLNTDNQVLSYINK